MRASLVRVALFGLVFSSIAGSAFAQDEADYRKYGIGSEGRQGLLMLGPIFKLPDYPGGGWDFDYLKLLQIWRASDNVSPLARRQATEPGVGDTALNFVAQQSFVRAGGGNGLSITAGPRVSKRTSPTMSVFGEFTAGFLSGGGETVFAIQPGGGVVVDTGNWLLAAALDFQNARYEGFSDTAKRIRVVIALPIGR